MRITPFMIVVSILLSGICIVPNAKAHTELSSATILRANADTITTGWNRYPATGSFYDKTFTNDTNDTYVTSGSAWQVIEFGMDNIEIAIDPNQSVNITFWIISRNTMATPASNTNVGITNVATSVSVIMYDSSTFRRAYRYAQANVWKNISFTTDYCPWSAQKWTGTTINQTYLYMWANALGTPTVTEIGAIVFIYDPVEVDYNYILVGLLIIVIITVGMFITFRIEKR